MNVNKTEGCLWHVRPAMEEEQPLPNAAGFIRLMEQVAALVEPEKLAAQCSYKQRYRLVEGPGAGMVFEVETQGRKTCLTLRVAQQALFERLKRFSSWLNEGLLAAGHNVTLEVVCDSNLA